MHLNPIIVMGPEWNNCRVSIITIGSVSPTVGPRNVIALASNLMSCVWSHPDKVCVYNQNKNCTAKRFWQNCMAKPGYEDSQQQVYLPRASACVSYHARLTCVWQPFPMYSGRTCVRIGRFVSFIHDPYIYGPLRFLPCAIDMYWTTLSYVLVLWTFV